MNYRQLDQLSSPKSEVRIWHPSSHPVIFWTWLGTKNEKIGERANARELQMIASIFRLQIKGGLVIVSASSDMSPRVGRTVDIQVDVRVAAD